MKPTTIIIAAVFSIQISTLFAANEFPPLTPNNDASVSCCVLLVPVTPAVATFEDDVTLMDYAGLAPITPMETTFEDNVDSNNSGMLIKLAPVTPLEADFNDDFNQTIDFITLAPTTPAEADFE